MKLKKVELINRIVELQEKQCSNYEIDALQTENDSLTVQKEQLIKEKKTLKSELDGKNKTIDGKNKIINDKNKTIDKYEKIMTEQALEITKAEARANDSEVLNEQFKEELDNNVTTIETLRKMTCVSIIVAVIAVAATIMAVVL